MSCLLKLLHDTNGDITHRTGASEAVGEAVPYPLSTFQAQPTDIKFTNRWWSARPSRHSCSVSRLS
jgi:hypothetical protein